MCHFFQNTKATEQIASLLINWIEIVSILSKIAAHFILFPDFLTAGEIYLIAKITVWMLAEIYMNWPMIFPCLSFLLKVLQGGWRLTEIIVHTPGHHVRPFLPVCILVPARIGRLPEANSPLCHMVRPSSREGK